MSGRVYTQFWQASPMPFGKNMEPYMLRVWNMTP